MSLPVSSIASSGHSCVLSQAMVPYCRCVLEHGEEGQHLTAPGLCPLAARMQCAHEAGQGWRLLTAHWTLLWKQGNYLSQKKNRERTLQEKIWLIIVHDMFFSCFSKLFLEGKFHARSECAAVASLHPTESPFPLPLCGLGLMALCRCRHSCCPTWKRPEASVPPGTWRSALVS